MRLFWNNNSRLQHGQFDCSIHHWWIQLLWNSCLQSVLIDDDSKIISLSTKCSRHIAHCGDMDTHGRSGGDWFCMWSMLSVGMHSALLVHWWSSQETLFCSISSSFIGNVVCGETYFLHTRTWSRYCFRSSVVTVSSFVYSSSLEGLSLWKYKDWRVKR